MAMRTRDHLQTMAYSYREICQGEQPWIALGNFMNDWFDNKKNRRPELVAEPMIMPENPTRKQRKWAAFIAGSVEDLCGRYGIPCPEWIHDPQYVLDKAWWYYAKNIRYASERKERIAKTPESYKRRHVYCGDRAWANKWELDELALKIREIRARKQALQQAEQQAPQQQTAQEV